MKKAERFSPAAQAAANVPKVVEKVIEKVKLTQEPVVGVKIKSTYEYDRFKLVGINRRVDAKHVSLLSEAILYRNLLHLFPLIINKTWEVMDGQHRLSVVKMIESAKFLQLPIYYIMDENITMDDMRLLNSNKINWKNIDYINFYAGKKLRAYIDLQNFMRENPKVNLTASLSILSSKTHNVKKDLMEGKLVVDRLDKGHLIMQYVYDLSKNIDPRTPFYYSRYFIGAVRRMVATGKYQHHVMMASTANRRENWQIQSSEHSYIFEMNNMYNHSLTEKEKVNFLKLTN